MLEGFKSRCNTPRWWAWWTAREMGATSRAAAPDHLHQLVVAQGRVRHVGQGIGGESGRGARCVGGLLRRFDHPAQRDRQPLEPVLVGEETGQPPTKGRVALEQLLAVRRLA